VVRDGMPVAGVLLSMSAENLSLFDAFSASITDTKTDDRGTFRFVGVVPDGNFWARADIASLEGSGIVDPVKLHTTAHGATVDLGDLRARTGRTLAGHLVASDGKAVPSGTVLRVRSDNFDGLRELKVSDAGWFESKDLPDGLVTLEVSFPKTVTGYRVSPRNKCLSPEIENQLEGRLDHNISDLTILLEPDTESDSQFRSVFDADPAAVADFNDAKAGPITGVAPRT
jgi:hypothetical protein